MVRKMQATEIFESSWDVNRRLASLGLEMSDIVEIVQAAISARNEAVDLHPNNAPGTLAYIFGIGAIRRLLLPRGWVIDRTDNIEATLNPRNGIKIIYQNVDSACNLGKTPKSVSAKGIASQRMVNQTGYLWDYMAEEDAVKTESAAWYICVAVTAEGICAELSCPSLIEGSQFIDFAERIFIVKPGEFDDFWRHEDDADNHDADDIDIQITRK